MMNLLLFLASFLALTSPLLGDSNLQCTQKAFVDHCCVSGEVLSDQFTVIGQIQNNSHACLAFDSRVNNPLMLGTWVFGKLHVRVMTGVSTGLCIESVGLPFVGYCINGFNFYEYSYQGCSCDFETVEIVCSNATVIANPVQSTCDTEYKPPSSDLYKLYTHSECESYLASIGI